MINRDSSYLTLPHPETLGRLNFGLAPSAVFAESRLKVQMAYKAHEKQIVLHIDEVHIQACLEDKGGVISGLSISPTRQTLPHVQAFLGTFIY